jgi:hypothetical protein
MGLSSAAASLGNIAMDTAEEADLLEFEINDQPVKAWVWISVFEEGDEVEVVVEPNHEGWVGYGIRRVDDGIVALYPHCSRGRTAHYRASMSWSIKLIGFLLAASFTIEMIVAVSKGIAWQDLMLFALIAIGGGLAGALILALVAYRTSRRFMSFVVLAESIFRGFGWQDVKNVDLPAITRKSKKPGDPPGLGIFFFRY